MTPEDKIIAAIDRNTEAVRCLGKEISGVAICVGLLWVGLCVVGCPRAKAAPLVSDGDETTSIGTEVRR